MEIDLESVLLSYCCNICLFIASCTEGVGLPSSVVREANNPGGQVERGLYYIS